MSRLIKADPKPTTPPQARIHQNGVTRPRKFFNNGRPNICVKVWEIADEISAQHAQATQLLAKKTKKKQPPAGPATRAEVLKACVAAKIKYTTFVNEFYSWRIFNGIRGRINKDGKPAKPYGFKGDKPRKGAKRPDIRPVVGKPPAPAAPVATNSPWKK